MDSGRVPWQHENGQIGLQGWDVGVCNDFVWDILRWAYSITWGGIQIGLNFEFVFSKCGKEMRRNKIDWLLFIVVLQFSKAPDYRRPLKPLKCSEKIYRIMRDGWNEKPDSRPSPQILISRLIELRKFLLNATHLFACTKQDISKADFSHNPINRRNQE